MLVIIFSFIKKRIKEKNESLEHASQISIIDNMDNFLFFEFAKKIYQESGYELSSEFDSEMIISAKKNNNKTGVKPVLSKCDVGIRDIEQIIALIDRKKIDSGHILTNKAFTFPVIDLSKLKNITLYDRKKLSELMIDLEITPPMPIPNSKPVEQ
jgi:HJR/Mrr/RecB family endonuclease